MEPRVLLLIEDDPDIRRVAEIALQFSEKFKVYGAGGGVEGISLARKYKPDVILLDVMMPDLDGIETCKRLKSDPETLMIPVIFLSARSREESIGFGEDLGAAGFIAKPFDPLQLSNQIEKILGLC